MTFIEFSFWEIHPFNFSKKFQPDILYSLRTEAVPSPLPSKAFMILNNNKKKKKSLTSKLMPFYTILFSYSY